jgi:large subunit ribosomal protein L30
MRSLKITLVKSPIGYAERQKRTVRALGLTRLSQSVVRPDNDQTRGMVKAISHLLQVEPAGATESKDQPDADS